MDLSHHAIPAIDMQKQSPKSKTKRTTIVRSISSWFLCIEAKVGSVLRTRYRYTYPFLFATPNSAPSPHALCLYPLSNQYSTHPSSHNAKPKLANPRFLLFLPFNGAHRALRRGLGAVPNIIGREKPRQDPCFDEIRGVFFFEFSGAPHPVPFHPHIQSHQESSKNQMTWLRHNENSCLKG